MASKKKSTNTTFNNSTLIILVVALVLFGLGYVVGRAKAKVTEYRDFSEWKQNMLIDKSNRELLLDQMMEIDEVRTLMMNAVDNYRTKKMAK